MKFGYSLMGLAPHDYAEVARKAEECGFDSIWVPEHLVFPAEMPQYPYVESAPSPHPGTRLYDPWVSLAFVAAATTKLRLGTHVYILPLRHPLVTAKAVATLDILSGGRALLGAGVGWLAEEFALAGQRFERRGARTDEIIEILRQLWSDRVIEHHGEFYDLAPLRFEPKPVQSPLPILIGGEAPPALRRAARLGDGWISANHAFDGLRESVARLQEMRRTAGREDASFEIMATTSFDAGLDDVRRRRDLGVTTAILVGPIEPGVRQTAEKICGHLEGYRDEILSRL
ncbi:MAG: LLM class F420-dependent oxidoreductase [Deltaproteobacteria bacterium]|jgi:probable F420-dependent oxidoreductase|nr:LLM class F420-dependent oxidoreductase [Deltaproteobacteria bacterium]MBW2495742.1 LLM class F420-dependent oxidoreductase [Deltaproteobacteria bacterium]